MRRIQKSGQVRFSWRTMKFITVEDYMDFKVVVLNRPEVKNAFQQEMIRELTEIFLKFRDDIKIRGVVLSGTGSAFCSGADLNWMKEMVNYSLDENLKDSEKLWEMFEAISLCKAPVIASVHGAVFGGALGLVACCDYVFAEQNTKFSFSEVRLGLAPAVISSFLLRKTVDCFLRPLMLSAEIFNVEKAMQAGLVHATFNDSLDTALITKNFAENGLEAMRETKALLNQIPEKSWIEQKKLTTKVISERRVSSEGQKKVNTFLNKK